MTKRSFDVIFATVVLIIASPLMLLVGLGVRLESPGPVIFTQQRVGLEGRIFNIFKFRSMVEDADSKGPHFTRDGDSRLTRVGRIIRKTSFDELPQLFNVLRGEMSIVGPRPNVPQQRCEYSQDQWSRRNSVRPGITGLAQATLRSDATLEERKQLDLSYVERASLRLDLWIILLTVKQVIAKGGN